MSPNPHVQVRVDLARIRRNVSDIAERTGVAVIAVVKADAYGLGAEQVARAIADLVDGFYVFDPAEALQYRLPESGRRTIAMLCSSDDPIDYAPHRIQPVIWDERRAVALRAAKPVLSVDVGQKRFGCDPAKAKSILKAGDLHEALAHATRPEHITILKNAVADVPGINLQAAGSALLNDPTAWLDAVRPGLAIYQNAARVSTRLIDARDATGPAGYGGFITPRHGLIRCGYSNGLRLGPCLVNGQRRNLLEVGMQSAFVELAPTDKTGDEVTLLGDGLTESDISTTWKCTPHEALFRLAGAGIRTYAK
jgi:alanine racemase